VIRLLILLLLLANIALAQQTVAEKSDYRATSRHADVLSFCDELVKKSASVRRIDMGKSGEGRVLPMLVLADPPIATPEDARKSGKLVVLAFANIHAGEVDGKEAVLMLAREIAIGAEKGLLKNLVILIVPILNADGNEKIDKANRIEQNGPLDGVGLRANAAGFDLNRDFVKLETPEVRSLASVVNRWDPAIVVDMHTTNGSHHRYTLTYDGPRHPAADTELIAIVRDKWLPEIGKQIEKDTGYKSFFYGNFSADRKAWESYQPIPRFGIQWLALRNRIGLLSESYSYASFKDRMLVGKAYARGIFYYAADHADEVRKLVVNADKPRERIAVRTKDVSLGECTVLGFVEEEKAGKRVATKETKDYTLNLMSGVEGTVFVQRPFAYMIPASFKTAIETLQRQGITVEELSEAAEIDVQVYKIEKLTKAERLFQKHNLVTLEIVRHEETRKLPAGTCVIRTNQRLGALASYLLEPQSEDGLATWNFFDAGLAEGKDFPVVRLAKGVKLKTRPVAALKEEVQTK